LKRNNKPANAKFNAKGTGGMVLFFPLSTIDSDFNTIQTIKTMHAIPITIGTKIEAILSG
jgi:hypothetical protein